MRDAGLPSGSSNADDGTGLGTVTRALTAILALLVAWARGMRLIACTLVSAARFVVGPLSHGALVLGRGTARAMRSLLSPIRAVGEPFVVAALRGLGALGRFVALWVRRTIARLRPPLEAARMVMIAVLHALVPVGRAVRRIVAAARRLLRVVFGALLAVLGPGIAATRQALAFLARLVGRVGAARGWVQRPVGRIGVAVVLAILLLASPHAAKGPTGVLWLVAVAYSAVPLGRRFRTATRDRLAPRLEFVRRRAAHSMRVATAKAGVDASRRHAVRPPSDSALVSSPAGRDLRFALAVSQNAYQPRNGTEVNAIIRVTAAAGGERARLTSSHERAEVMLIDCSGSMAYPMAKFRAATAATAAAVDTLRDGTWFAIVRSTHVAEQVFPRSGLARASNETRGDAKRALKRLWPEGGTAMGQWLRLARELLATRPAAIAHAILLTDGRNESEAPAVLDSALAACTGLFQCDCRGVGTDWDVAELRKIAASLLGTVDIVAEPSALDADFRSMMNATMAKLTGGVALRLWTPKGARVRFLKQVSPEIVDITGKRTAVDDRTADYPIGAWGAESRDYHLSLQVQAKEIGAEMLAARVSIVGGQLAAPALIKAVWTDDEQLSTQVNRRVGHYTDQAELAKAIQDGLEARKAGDEATATLKLGRAVQIAARSGNDNTTQLLQAVVEIDDAATGSVRLKPAVDAADEMTLDTRSTKTVPLGATRSA
jgi:von Willebrand factor type A C-terminal domain/von Willebrand factor type A domain